MNSIKFKFKLWQINRELEKKFKEWDDAIVQQRKIDNNKEIIEELNGEHYSDYFGYITPAIKFE